MAMWQGQAQGGLPMQSHLDKVPLGWYPGADNRYPYKKYQQDCVIWARTTSLDAEKIGFAMVLRLWGTAREVGLRLFRMPTNLHGVTATDSVLEHGWLFPNGVFKHGWQILLRQLDERFGRLTHEKTISYMTSFFTFRPKPTEGPDAIIARFEHVREGASERVGLTLAWVSYSYVLLTCLGVPRRTWPLLFTNLGGNIPADEAGYRQLLSILRLNEHLCTAVQRNEQDTCND